MHKKEVNSVNPRAITQRNLGEPHRNLAKTAKINKSVVQTLHYLYSENFNNKSNKTLNLKSLINYK